MEFNVDSPSQLSILLFGGSLQVSGKELVGIFKGGAKKGLEKYKNIKYEVKIEGLGLIPRPEWKNKKGYSTDEEVLKIIAEKTETGKSPHYSTDMTDASEIANIILKIRGLQKELSTYYLSTKELIYEDNCIHSQFNNVASDCITLDTLILTQRGVIEAYKVQLGDYVISHTGIPRKVYDIIDNGVKLIYKITLVNGMILECTGNHPILTHNSWINAKELKVGENIVVYGNEEVWSLIEDWENYMISSWGRVKNIYTNHIITQHIQNKWGHLKVTLLRNKAQTRNGGDKKDFRVARLVAKAFLPKNLHYLQEVRHLNGLAFDNNVKNLKWGTRKENAQDACEHYSLQKAHEKQRKLTDKEIDFIRKSSKTDSELALKYKVCRQYINAVKRYKVRKNYLRQEKKLNFTTSQVKYIQVLEPKATIGISVDIDKSHLTNGIISHNTGRLSCRSPNAQNQPTPPSLVLQHFVSRFSKQIECQNCADTNYCWNEEYGGHDCPICKGNKVILKGIIISADYKSIEPRVEAEDCQDPQLIEDIINEVDPHTNNLSLAERVSYEEADKKVKSGEWKEKRSRIKGFTFAQQYLASIKTTARNSGLLEREVEEILKARKNKYPGLYTWHDRNFKDVETNGYYTSCLGRRFYFKMKQGSFGGEYLSKNEIANYKVQGTAFDIVMIMIGKFWREKALYNRDKYLMINNVHDNLMLDCKEEFKSQALNDLKVLELWKDVCYTKFNLNWNTPILIDCKSGSSWYECS